MNMTKLGPGDDLEMMKSPDQWSSARLPLLRGKAPNQELAFLVMGWGPRLFYGNIFMPTGESKDYTDFEAIVDDGWVVD